MMIMVYWVYNVGAPIISYYYFRGFLIIMIIIA